MNSLLTICATLAFVDVSLASMSTEAAIIEHSALTDIAGKHQLSPQDGVWCDCKVSDFTTLADFVACIDKNGSGCGDHVQVTDKVQYTLTTDVIDTERQKVTLPYTLINNTGVTTVEITMDQSCLHGEFSIDDQVIEDGVKWSSVKKEDGTSLARVVNEAYATYKVSGTSLSMRCTSGAAVPVVDSATKSSIVYTYDTDLATTTSTTASPDGRGTNTLYEGTTSFIAIPLGLAMALILNH